LLFHKEVTRRHVTWLGPLPGGVVTQNVPTVLYFDNLGKMDLSQRASSWIVRVWNADGLFVFRMVTRNADRARRFMDGMAVLSVNAMAQSETRRER
jgi:hypothetical protein